MILGLTHRADGSVIQRLTIAYKVSIGVPASGDSNYPKKSDHFHIRAKAASGDWVDDAGFAENLRSIYMPEIVAADGKKSRPPLREFDVLFLHDSEGQDGEGHWKVPESIFRTELAWWATSEKKCSGNGREAMRVVSIMPPADQAKYKGERYAPWSPCGDACPDLEAGRCKPSGRLFFIFKDRPIMGSVAEYSTTSYETIARVQSSLIQIMSVTGGRLRGIPLKMVIRPGRTSYQDPQGKRKTGTAFFVNIEFRQADFAQLVPKLIEYSVQHAQAISTGRRMLAASTEEDEAPIEATIEDHSETEMGKSMTDEFYPENRASSPAVATSGEGGREATEDNDESVIASTCAKLGLNPAHREMLNRALKGDLTEIRKWITAFDEGVVGLKMPAPQILEFYTRVILTPGALAQEIQRLTKTNTEPSAGRRERKPKPKPEEHREPSPPPPKAPTADNPAVSDEQLGSFNF